MWRPADAWVWWTDKAYPQPTCISKVRSRFSSDLSWRRPLRAFVFFARVLHSRGRVSRSRWISGSLPAPIVIGCGNARPRHGTDPRTRVPPAILRVQNPSLGWTLLLTPILPKLINPVRLLQRPDGAVELLGGAGDDGNRDVCGGATQHVGGDGCPDSAQHVCGALDDVGRAGLALQLELHGCGLHFQHGKGGRPGGECEEGE